MDLHTRIQRAAGAIECEKVMSRHVYWHSAGIHRDEWEEYWSKRVKITWGHGWGRQDDRYSYYFSYVLEKERNAFKSFMRTKLKYPDAENCVRLDGMAEYSNHLTTSPVIEVADDGKSAKGLWYTPGFINSHASDNGQVRSQALWERYGGDFVLEDGRWLYSNLRVCPDIGGNVGGGGYAYRVRMPMGPPPEMMGKGGPGGPGGAPGGPGGSSNEDIPGLVKKKPGASGAAQEMVVPCTPGPLFTDWTKFTVPQVVPIPEPYTTESEIWQYCDNGPVE
jgi:hypothetical protein